jgi:hypothetical protein
MSARLCFTTPVPRTFCGCPDPIGDIVEFHYLDVGDGETFEIFECYYCGETYAQAAREGAP